MCCIIPGKCRTCRAFRWAENLPKKPHGSCCTMHRKSISWVEMQTCVIHWSRAFRSLEIVNFAFVILSVLCSVPLRYYFFTRKQEENSYCVKLIKTICTCSAARRLTNLGPICIGCICPPLADSYIDRQFPSFDHRYRTKVVHQHESIPMYRVSRKRGNVRFRVKLQPLKKGQHWPFMKEEVLLKALKQRLSVVSSPKKWRDNTANFKIMLLFWVEIMLACVF
jgi:hypothetical protein